MKKVGKLFLGLFLGAAFLFAGCSDGSSSNNAALMAMMSSQSSGGTGGHVSADGNSADEGYVGSFAPEILNAVSLANTLDSANEKLFCSIIALTSLILIGDCGFGRMAVMDHLVMMILLESSRKTVQQVLDI